MPDDDFVETAAALSDQLSVGELAFAAALSGLLWVLAIQQTVYWFN